MQPISQNELKRRLLQCGGVSPDDEDNAAIMNLFDRLEAALCGSRLRQRRLEAAIARAERAEEALRQCRVEIERFQHLSYGKTDFPPTKGMELADAILSSSAPTQPKVRIA